MSQKTDKSLLVLLFLLVYIPFIFNYGWRYIPIQNLDFPTWYFAAKVAFESHQSPYNYSLLLSAGSVIEQRIISYWHFPMTLLFFYPLIQWPYEAAKTAMLVASHLAIWFFLFIFLIRIMKWDFKQLFTAFAAIYVFSCYQVVHTLKNGQINIIVLVLLCLTWYALKKNSKPLLTAFPLSLAILIKMQPMLFIVYLFLKKRHKVLLWLSGLLGSYTAVSLIVLPSHLWREWFTIVLPSASYGRGPIDFISPANPWNQSLNGFISRIFLKNPFSEILFDRPDFGRALTYLIAAAVLLTVIGVCHRASKRGDKDQWIDLEFSLFLLTSYILSPFSWEHHLVLVLPAVIFALYLAVYSDEKTPWKVLIGFVVLLIAWDLPYASAVLQKGILTLGLSIRFYAVVCLWVYFVTKLMAVPKSDSHQR